MGLKPREWIDITHRDYVNMCVGFFRLSRDREYKERQLHWFNYVSVADVKKSGMTIQKFWPIAGEQTAKPIKISQKEVYKAFMAMQNFGKNNKKNIN